MIVDKLNADSLLVLIANEGVEVLGHIVQSILSSLFDIKIDELEAQANKRIVLKHRRFGKGALLLGPFGYFHPSETISVVTDNASRGRLLKKGDGCAYLYDFDANGEIAAITFIDNKTRTICERIGKVGAYLTYRTDDDGLNEIVDVTLTKYADNGLLEIMLQIALFFKGQEVAHINVDMNEPLVGDQRVCHTYTIIPNDSSKVLCCFPYSYRMFYDDHLKIIDWESLPEEKMMEITL